MFGAIRKRRLLKSIGKKYKIVNDPEFGCMIRVSQGEYKDTLFIFKGLKLLGGKLSFGTEIIDNPTNIKEGEIDFANLCKDIMFHVYETKNDAYELLNLEAAKEYLED